MTKRTMPDIIASLKNGDKLSEAERNMIADVIEKQVTLLGKLRILLDTVVVESAFRQCDKMRKSANRAIGAILEHKKEYKI